MNQEMRFILSGFGGQGLLFGGKVIAYAGLIEDRQVSRGCPRTAPRCEAEPRTAR